MTRSIETFRHALDAIDSDLLDRLAERQQVVDLIGLIKRTHRQSIRDEHREEHQRTRLRQLAERNGLGADAADGLLDAILDQSRQRQSEGPPQGALKVAIQGQPDSWSALSLAHHLGEVSQPVHCATFREALSALRSERAQLALVPVHNSTIGTVRPAAELVTAPDLVTLAELAFPVHHCLATVAPVALSDISHVHSQPPALHQCTNRLAQLGVTCVDEADTAAAADVVRTLADPTHAVLCSPQAAERRGLVIIERNLNDHPENATTWTLLARRPAPSRPWRLSARFGRPDHVVSIGEVRVGGSETVVMAGPCSVESEKQLRTAATAVKAAGARVLRGGAFKPRTSPWSFQGLGEPALELLATVGAELGLPVVTEVMQPDRVAMVCEYADVLQIGARSMQNTPLLRAVGRVDKPILLKRGASATLDEWLGAADYILAEGNDNVILCERGIRTFSRATRNTLDLSVIPVLRERTHLPILIDPSHAVGVARWIPDMAVAAVAAGAHGLIVEVHPEPSEALSDGAQALTPEGFDAMMARVRAVTQAMR
ncbi:MAG: 3-deoxy-7-phosphoheptulonate synthase [Myxococcota bacterium]